MQNFITKYFLPLCFAFFGPALLVSVLPFASFIQFNASPANKADGDRTDYYISHGFDFANGANLIENRWNGSYNSYTEVTPTISSNTDVNTRGPVVLTGNHGDGNGTFSRIFQLYVVTATFP